MENKKHEPLELTNEMVERNDVIDNAVYECAQWTITISRYHSPAVRL